MTPSRTNRLRTYALSILLLTMFALAWASPSIAATYPERPISLYLPLAPGGATDNLARAVTNLVGPALGQRFTIQHRPGAGGSIASNTVARARPDGYRLLFANFATHAVTPSLFASLPYDPINGFRPVSLLASQGHLVLVPATSALNSLDDLIVAAESDTLRFASSGIGSPLHLAAEYFASTLGVEMEHIPYGSSAPALQDLIAGRVDFMFDNISSGRGFVESGDLRAIMFTGPERSGLLPEVPTASELGLEGFQTYGWWGVMAPAGTPDPIIDVLSGAFMAAMRDEQLASDLRSQGFNPVGSNPDEFAQHIAEEIARWAVVLENVGLKGTQ